MCSDDPGVSPTGMVPGAGLLKQSRLPGKDTICRDPSGPSKPAATQPRSSARETTPTPSWTT